MEWEAGWGNLQQPNVPSFPAGWRNHPKVEPSVVWFAGLEFEQWGEHWKIFLGHSAGFLSLFYWRYACQMVINYPPPSFRHFTIFPFYPVCSPSLFALLKRAPRYIFGGLPVWFSHFFPSFFPLFLRPVFVNVQRGRMREQIMKHRSAFHTLFRKNSPTAQRGREGTSPRYSTPTFSPDRSSVSTISRFVRVIGSYNADAWRFHLLSVFLFFLISLSVWWKKSYFLFPLHLVPPGRVGTCLL